MADASDPAALKALVAQAKVVITTVGPYQIVGNELVAACAEAGTDYVDLCGEPGWMAAEDSTTAKGRRGQWRPHRVFLRFRLHPV